jgi:hypothetical protein
MVGGRYTKIRFHPDFGIKARIRVSGKRDPTPD